MKTTFAKLLLLVMLIGGIGLPAFAQTDDQTEQSPPVLDLSRVPPVQADKRDEIVAIQQKLLAEGYAKGEDLKLLLDYAVWLHVFGEATEARNRQIDEIISIFRFNIDTSGYFGSDFVLDTQPYEGSDERIVDLVWVASVSDVMDDRYRLPCTPLRARISLLDATLIASFHPDFRRPVAWCEFFPKYEKYAWNIWNCCTGYEKIHGTIVGLVRRNYQNKLNQAPFKWLENKPSQKLLNLYPEGAPVPAIDGPLAFQKWSYLSPDNRDIFLTRINPEFQAAIAETASAYAENYKAQYGKRDALYATLAVDALSPPHFGTLLTRFDCEEVQVPILRKVVVDGVDSKTVRQLLEGGALENRPKFIFRKLNYDVTSCLSYAGLDPVIFFAVDDAKVLEVFLGFGPKAGAWGPTFSPNAVNSFDKTVLMVAAQRNRLESAKLLLAYGADIAARTHQREAYSWVKEEFRDYHGAVEFINHERRTALMYAAANASLPLIELLIAHGADVCNTDSLDQRAIDYFADLSDDDVPWGDWKYISNSIVKDRARALEVLSDADC